ncbi:hypothetical protein [Rhodococcus sp. YH1]|uniref:hypothetical protein n=1 Tax=Rhodococcus sp. YH1 TaxID=89066 RepID=UPI0013867DBD|nr:hypothetical protein [Rhodococcus sp. YH1]
MSAGVGQLEGVDAAGLRIDNLLDGSIAISVLHRDDLDGIDEWVIFKADLDKARQVVDALKAAIVAAEHNAA